MAKVGSRERAARFSGDGSEFVFDEADFLEVPAVKPAGEKKLTESERLELAAHLLWSDAEGNVYP